MLRLSLAGQSRHCGLIETLADVYVAKRVSEVAPGVGKATDMTVIDEKGIWACPAELCDVLDGIHMAVSARATPDLRHLKERYDALRA